MNHGPTPVIETRRLTRIFSAGTDIRALDEVDLIVHQGEFVSVMGPSGSGKSTLLNMVGALDRPTSGQVFVDGENVAGLKDVDAFRSHKIGFIFQLHNLLPTMTARENVEVPMIGQLSPAARRKRSAELMELVGLADRMKHLPGQLSGGQRQRVAVARALANKPPIVLADEPTGSLDSQSGKALMQLLRELNEKQGVTFLVVTHDPAVARQTRRVLVMADGKIVREDIIGSPLEEDIKMWRHSGLGRRLLQNDSAQELENLGIDPSQREALAKFLDQFI